MLVETVSFWKTAHCKNYCEGYSHTEIPRDRQHKFEASIFFSMADTMEPSRQCLQHHMAVRMEDCILVISSQMHEIWSYNLWTEQWWQCEIPRGKTYPETILNSGVAIESEIYVFGGTDFSNTFWKLTRNTNNSFEWNPIHAEDCPKVPSPRLDQSSWAYEGKLWIFGGEGKSPSGFLNHHGKFMQVGIDYQNNQLVHYDPSMHSWTDVKSSGAIPSPRSRVSTAIMENKAWLYGGAIGFQVNQELFQLNMVSLSWTQIKTRFPQPPHVYPPSSLTPLTASQLFLHSAINLDDFKDLSVSWILDVESYTWKQLPRNLRDAHKRFGHSGTTGLHSDVIILGTEMLTKPNSKDIYSPIFSVRLKPKSLQKLAMIIIYHNRSELPWKSLPPKLISKMIGHESL